MWILDQCKTQLVNVEGNREITIADIFDIEVSGESYDTTGGGCLLGSYDPAGRTKEVFAQLTDWVAAGAQGVFRMPEE